MLEDLNLFVKKKINGCWPQMRLFLFREALFFDAIGECAQVVAAGRLKDPQTEMRGHSQNVVKNVRLNTFKIRPVGGDGKGINFNRQSIFG